MSAFSLVTVISCVIGYANANIALPNDWQPLPYGECTVQGPTPSVTSAAIYESTHPNISYLVNDVCEFGNFDTNQLPKEYQDGYLLFAAQDVYNGFHVVTGYESINCRLYTKDETDSSADCAQACGTCYRISGPAGSSTWIVTSVSKSEFNVEHLLVFLFVYMISIR